MRYIRISSFSYMHDPLAQLAEHLTFNQRVRSSNLRWLTKTKISLFLKRNSEIFVYHKVLLVRLSHHSYAVQARSQGRCEDGSVIFRAYARRIDSSGPSLYFAFTGSKCPNCLFSPWRIWWPMLFSHFNRVDLVLPLVLPLVFVIFSESLLLLLRHLLVHKNF